VADLCSVIRARNALARDDVEAGARGSGRLAAAQQLDELAQLHFTVL
jgi:hypothetical protein